MAERKKDLNDDFFEDLRRFLKKRRHLVLERGIKFSKKRTQGGRIEARTSKLRFNDF